MFSFLRRLRPFSGAVLAVAACVLAAYLEVVAGIRFIGWDSYDYLYPKFLYLVDSLKSGYFPLWNPFELSGVPLWPWNGGLLNPVNLVFVLLSLVFRPDYVFQLMLLSPVMIGGLGAYLLFKSLRYSEPASLFGAAAFSLVMFGPILGQYSIAYAVAFAPWIFYMAVELADARGAIGAAKTCLFALGLAAFVITSYPAMIFLVGAPALLFWAFRLFSDGGGRTAGRAAGTLLLVLGLAGAASSVAVFPMLENRALASEQLKGDFVSPDPRLRVSLSKADWKVGYKRNYLNLAKGTVTWHGSFSLILFFLLLPAGFRCFKDRNIPFFLFLALVFASYVKGRGGMVYEFVFDHVPLFWNNRYPVIGLSMLKFFALVISIGQLEYLIKLAEGGDAAALAREERRLAVLGAAGLLIILLAVFKPYFWPFAVSIPVLAISFYSYLRGKVHLPVLLGVLAAGLVLTHYMERGYYYKAESAAGKMSAGRTVSVDYLGNSRLLLKSKEYIYDNPAWVFSKKPVNQGYYTADTPSYWYLKNQDFLADIFFLTDRVKAQAAEIKRENFRTDNEFMDALTAQVTVSSGAVTVVDRLPEGFALRPDKAFWGTVSGVAVSPNEFSASVETRQPSLLVLTDKDYPGWNVYVDGEARALVRANICFKAVYLEAGKHQVRFVFEPMSFFSGLAVSAAALAAMGLFCLIRRKREIGRANA